MTDIPEDIKRAAKSFSPCHQEPTGCINSDDDSCAEGCEVKAAIARAILAERERCASMAREHVFDGHAMAQATEFGRGCHETATRIATAIRSPERAGE